MTKITKRKSVILLAIGMFIITITQIFSHYTHFSDGPKGTFTGIGIGVLLIALLAGKFKSAYSN